jgi:hypothetical protein
MTKWLSQRTQSARALTMRGSEESWRSNFQGPATDFRMASSALYLRLRSPYIGDSCCSDEQCAKLVPEIAAEDEEASD